MNSNELPSQVINELSAIAFRVAMGVLRDRDPALDIAQEVLINTHEKLPVLGGDNRIQAYVARSAYNRALNAQRNATARRDKLEGKMVMNHPAPTKVPGEQAELKSIVTSAVSQLADRQNQALTLRFFQGLKIREIAMVMAITEGAVKTHLARGLVNLKVLLEDLEGVL